MANQKEITLRQGEVSPKDIVLHDLPVADLQAQTTIYLSEFDATPKNVVLSDPTVQPQSAGPITITGDLAATDGSDTAAFVGDVAHVGTLAATDSADTAAFAGDIDHAGTLAATDGADTFVADGTVTSGAATITGDLAATDDGDTAAMDGVVVAVIEIPRKYSGVGYLVDDGRKRETITLYDEEAEILELLAAIMPVIQAQQQRRAI